ncbi:MAG: nucleoside monophosphate kinase [Candidatus Aenigmarchaeota archaeon]|nr:nucleoside monophosphate kinase [Candidatus Aenigmarchaeota archaeon]
MIYLIIGPPASGKGTTASRMKAEFQLEHISSGDLFRELNDEEIRKYLVSGRLLPDELVARVVERAIKGKDNYILDGYPRNLAQAKLLDQFLKNDGKEVGQVIYLETGNDKIIQRMTNRRVCSKCGKIYNLVTLPPPKPGKCECGGELFQREDDKEAIILGRIDTFNRQTKPVLDHYNDQLLTINGEKEIEGIMEEVRAGINR